MKGRMKSSYYVATVVKSYREALDAYFKDPLNYEFDSAWLDEMSKASHRELPQAFILGSPPEMNKIIRQSSYIREYDFVGLSQPMIQLPVLRPSSRGIGFATGESLEVVSPRGPFWIQTAGSMEECRRRGYRGGAAPAKMTVTMPMDRPVEPYTMLRRKGAQ